MCGKVAEEVEDSSLGTPFLMSASELEGTLPHRHSVLRVAQQPQARRHIANHPGEPLLVPQDLGERFSLAQGRPDTLVFAQGQQGRTQSEMEIDGERLGIATHRELLGDGERVLEECIGFMPVLGGAIFQMAAKSFFPNTVSSLRSTTKVVGTNLLAPFV